MNACNEVDKNHKFCLINFKFNKFFKLRTKLNSTSFLIETQNYINNKYKIVKNFKQNLDNKKNRSNRRNSKNSLQEM